jgi:2-phospho-L-lactate guanylyltransferase (CobY/MobA/RfbA family)
LRKLFGGSPKPEATKSVSKAKKSDYVAVDETQVKAEIVKNLTEFFKLQEQLEAHIRDSEEKARTVVFSDDVNLMEEALNRVLAQQEMERLVVQIRECMVYQSPPEMGALYSEVFSMRDIIAEEQAKARKMRDAEQWQRKERERLLAEKQAYLLVVFLFLLYLWMLIGLVSKIGRA